MSDSPDKSASEAFENVADPWARLGLALNGRRIPYANLSNAVLILRKHQTWRGRIWFDTFSQRIKTDTSDNADWTDADDFRVLDWIQTELEIPSMNIDSVRQGVVLVANDDRRSAPMAYLNSLEWDRMPRLLELGPRGWGTSNSDYELSVGENLMLSLAARILKPGCRVDNVVILEGPQGAMKTESLRRLGGIFFGELSAAMATADFVQEMRGKLLIELGELQSLSGRTLEQTKAFITRTIDTLRLPYARHAIDIPRQCCFVGTTNDDQYLKDSTGARRFWPVKVGRVDVDWISRFRDQLYAEAAQRVKDGATWWEMPEGEAVRAQDHRYLQDPWHSAIADYLVGQAWVTTAQILSTAIKMEVHRQDKAAEMRVGAELRRLGWVRCQSGPKRERGWRPANAGSGAEVDQFGESIDA